MGKTRKTGKSLVLGMVLVVLLATAGLVFAAGNQAQEEGGIWQLWDLAPANLDTGNAERTQDGELNTEEQPEHLFLWEKNPDGWTIIEDGAWGRLVYFSEDNPNNEFAFSGYELDIGTEDNEQNNFLENAVEVSPGVFYLGESQDINGKPVKGYAFVHYAKGYEPEVSETADSTDDTSTCYGFVFGPNANWEWLEPYVINPANDRGLNSSEILDKFETSVTTWENKIELNVIGDGTITDEKINWRKLDYTNMVRFGNLPGSAIAMNILWGTTDGEQLVEWDQIYDDKDFDWSLDCEGDDCTSKMDFQNIATHELGHAFGLGDLYTEECVEQTMYGYSDFGETEKRSLAEGDIAGIQVLYGE